MSSTPPAWKGNKRAFPVRHGAMYVEPFATSSWLPIDFDEDALRLVAAVSLCSGRLLGGDTGSHDHDLRPAVVIGDVT